MKKVLAATYEFFSRDPRAYKIDVALSKQYDVTAFVKEEDLSAFSATPVKFVTVKEDEQNNKYIRLFRFWRKLIVEAKIERPDFLVAHNYYLVIPAYVIKKVVGCKVIYDSYELYVPSKRNKLPKRQLLFYYLERLCIRSFDLVIAANEERARMMKVKFRLPERPLSVMNISSSLFEKIDYEKVIEEKYPSLLSLTNKIKLVYQGVLSGDRELDKLVDIIALLKDEFSLIYVGDGPEKEMLQKKAEVMSLSNRVLFTGRVPMQDISPILSFCDYGIVSYPFGDYNNRYCAPNKIFEYPGAGLPMISSEQATIVSLTNKYDIVQYVNYSKTEETARLISQFSERVNKTNAKSRIDNYLQNVSWEKEENKLLETISKLC